MSTEDDGNELMLIMRGCKADISWQERSRVCGELLRLVRSQRVRDVDTLPRGTYSFLLESIRLGWEHPEGRQVRGDAQAAFAGLTGFPEFETHVAADFVDDGFLMELCSRFQAGVSEERVFLRDMLHWGYASFPHKRRFLRQQIGSVLAQFVRTPGRNFHVAEMLQVMRHIIKGFPHSLTQVKSCTKAAPRFGKGTRNCELYPRFVPC